MEEISKASEETSKIMKTIDEESASASEEMNAQAGQMKVVVEQLVTLVSGRGGKVSLARKETSGTPASISNRSQPWSARPLGVSKAHKGTEVALKKRGEVRPEEVIPMEEGEFKDF